MTTVGQVIDLVDADGKEVVFQEGESGDVEAKLQHGTDDILKTDIGTLTLTLFDEDTSTIINSRDGVDILDQNGGTVADDGTVTMRLDPDDNALVGSPSAGDIQANILRFIWTWNDGVKNRTGKQDVRIRVEKLATPVSPS